MISYFWYLYLSSLPWCSPLVIVAIGLISLASKLTSNVRQHIINTWFMINCSLASVANLIRPLLFIHIIVQIENPFHQKLKLQSQITTLLMILETNWKSFRSKVAGMKTVVRCRWFAWFNFMIYQILFSLNRQTLRMVRKREGRGERETCNANIHTHTHISSGLNCLTYSTHIIRWK